MTVIARGPGGQATQAGDGTAGDARVRYFPLALLLLMVLSSLLVAWRVQQFELEIARDRSIRQATQLAGELERAFTFGLSAHDLGFLEATLEKRLAEDRELVAAWVFDAAGEPVARRGRSSVETGFKRGWTQRLDGKTRRVVFSHSPCDFVGVIAVDPLGQPAATLWLVHDRGRVFQRGEALLVELVQPAAWATLAAVALFVLLRALPSWRPHRPDGALSASGYAVLALLTLLVAVPIVLKAKALARPLIDTQIQTSARMLGSEMADQINRATALGVPLHALPGIEGVLRATLAQAREFSYLSLVGDGMRRLASARADGVPETSGGGTSWAEVSVDLDGEGVIRVGYPRDVVSKMLTLAIGDLLFAVLIAGIVVWELAQALPRPKGAPAPDALGDIRFYVFVVSLSEELLRPFFAPFAAEASSSLAQVAALSPTALAGLPVMAFMTALALSQPFGVSLSESFDVRRSMILSALLGALALIGSGLSSDVLVLTLLRGVNGVCYGLSLIFAQMAILRLIEPERRARALAEFATAIVAAGIVGPALGAMAAERFGFQAAFMLCAATYLAAALLARRLHFDSPVCARQRGSSLRALLDFLRHGEVCAVTLLAAIPARLLAAAVLLLITPLYLIEAGEATTVIGRVLPLYFIAFLVTAPWIARWSDRSGQRKPFVIAGCLLSGAACALLPWVGGASGAALGCLLLGLGQAVLSAPQMALVTELCARRGAAAVADGLAAFRFVERAGSVVAAPVAALCVSLMGLSLSFAALGVAAVLAGFLLLLLLGRGLEPAAVEEGKS